MARRGGGQLLSISMNKTLASAIIAVCAASSLSCDDEIRWDTGGDTPVSTDFAGMYILCEGLYNMNNSLLAYNTKEEQYAYHVVQALRSSVSGNMVKCSFDGPDGMDVPVFASVAGNDRSVILSGKSLQAKMTLKIELKSDLNGKKVSATAYLPLRSDLIRLSARKITPIVDPSNNDIYVTLEPGTFMLIKIS